MQAEEVGDQEPLRELGKPRADGWLTPVILASWEAEIGRIVVRDQYRQIVRWDSPISKTTKAKWTGGVANAVEHLLWACEALRSNPDPTGKKRIGRLKGMGEESPNVRRVQGRRKRGVSEIVKQFMFSWATEFSVYGEGYGESGDNEVGFAGSK
jgi:hypothetical protein